MNIKIFAAIATLTAPLAVMPAAHAAVGIHFDVGNVAIGYSDGYYDRDHHWHRWAHRADMEGWRHDHESDWHNWRHNDRHHHD